MGFLDALKRWRLAQQGLSSGKKRRIHTENQVVQALDNSVWLRLSLLLAFSVCCSLLVLRAGSDAVFHAQPAIGGLYALVISVIAIVMNHLTMRQRCHRNSRVILVYGSLLAHLLLLKSLIHLSSSGLISDQYLIFILPYCLSPMLHGILLGRAVGCFSSILVTFIGVLLVPRQDVMPYMLLSISAGMLSVMVAHQVRKRVQLLQTGIYVGALIVLICMIIGRLDVTSAFGENAMSNLQELGLGTLCAFAVALFIALLISGFLPIFEGLFNLTTDISWLELSDLNHKLLRKMQLEAPGTFHHSLIVASLSEAAAESIGANAPMCRVCSYFHDVGKLKKPSYFIENLHEGTENPHDALTPTMSALIIIAHVKDGVDFAVKHKLNPRIIDVIQEHHGDSLVAYFYHRAQEQKQAEMEKVNQKLENPEDLPKIDEKNFRYPGPRPKTRESAIIAMADTIESASRTLRKPTPGRIRVMVDELVRAKLESGLLDESPLSIQELAKIRKSFASTLRSMMHSRIDYPKDDDTGPLTTKISPGNDQSANSRITDINKRENPKKKWSETGHKSRDKRLTSQHA
ncbi:MAG: HD family phosphohydrolase [Luteolibacter sp.]